MKIPYTLLCIVEYNIELQYYYYTSDVIMITIKVLY